MACKGTTLPERDRASRVLILRRTEMVVPFLEAMASSDSADERFLTWEVYGKAVRDRQLPAPQSFNLALVRYKNEQNRYVRERIMRFLGVCKAKEAVPLLTAALAHDFG